MNSNDTRIAIERLTKMYQFIGEINNFRRQFLKEYDSFINDEFNGLVYESKCDHLRHEVTRLAIDFARENSINNKDVR